MCICLSHLYLLYLMCICCILCVFVLSYVYLFISFVFVVPYVYLLYLMCICFTLYVFVVSYVYLLYLICICCILYVFVVLCAHCCSYFRCRTAGKNSVSGRSCDQPPRHRFFLVSLRLQVNAEMVPKFQSCHYMLLM